MNETSPVTQQEVPAEDNRIADPAKALEMAYAGKFQREQAVGLANSLEATINNGEDIVTDPFFNDSTGKAKLTHTIREAVELADGYNGTADEKESSAGQAYDHRKAESDAALAQLEAIKAGKRIVQNVE